MDPSWIKVLTFLGIWAVIWLPIAVLVSFLIKWQPGKELNIQQKLYLLASLYILVPVVIGWKFEAESLSWNDLGLNLITGWQWYLLLGLGLGIVSLVITFLWELVFGLIGWHWPKPSLVWPIVLPVLGLSLVISLVEEVVFRGYMFTVFSQDASWMMAAAVSSLIFALLHLIWERRQTLPQVPGLWLMGMVLVAGRSWGGNSIYFSLGLHAAWIWGLTCIDSLEMVSYKFQDHWFTGWKQQPLAGLAGIFCLSLTLLIMVPLWRFWPG